MVFVLFRFCFVYIIGQFFWKIFSFPSIVGYFESATTYVGNLPRVILYIGLRDCPYKTSAVRGKEGLSSVYILRGGGSSDADVRTFWCKKPRIFRNLWCVFTDKERGVESMRTVEGVNFSRFCADAFYGRPLIGWNLLFVYTQVCHLVHINVNSRLRFYIVDIVDV